MFNENIHTEFADPSRCENNKIFLQSEHIKALPMIKNIVDLVPDAFLVLNEQRQIVFCNNTFLTQLGNREEVSVYGKKPGEALHCIHAGESEGGCGTTRFCVYCGAVNAILKSQKEPESLKTDECNILAEGNVAMNFKVWTKTIEIEKANYTFFLARDISAQKNMQILEKIFFHDIMNTAGGLSGLVDLLIAAEPDELDELVNLVKNIANTLIDEINAQKMIVAANNGELSINKQPLDLLELIQNVADVYKNHIVAYNKKINVILFKSNIMLDTDRAILKRIIGNMVKNALEATPEGESISIQAEDLGEDCCIKVQNPGVMPESAQMQVFQRSFSTKGVGRGLGTHSIKLLGETFLHGKVSFESHEKIGTEFKIILPKS